MNVLSRLKMKENLSIDPRLFAGKRVRFAVCMLGLIAGLMGLAGCGGNEPANDSFPDTLSRYDYRTTRQLVHFVRRAASLVRKKGPAAFEIMHKNSEAWKMEDSYIYAYTLDGLCLYNGGMPEMETQNIDSLKDASGKQLLSLMRQATEDPANPDGWLHFAWAPPNRFYEVEKTSCHYRVAMPNGETVLVGGGLTEPLEEREFARCSVDSAIRLIKQDGARALEEIREPSSRFRYRGVSVFILSANGTALIDPGIQLTTPRNLTGFVDDVGNHPFRNAYPRLKKEDRIWLVMLTRSRYERNLIKRAIYLRLASLDGQDVMVGAIVPVPRPAWNN